MTTQYTIILQFANPDETKIINNIVLRIRKYENEERNVCETHTKNEHVDNKKIIQIQ